jgi:hypothetical protein
MNPSDFPEVAKYRAVARFFRDRIPNARYNGWKDFREAWATTCAAIVPEGSRQADEPPLYQTSDDLRPGEEAPAMRGAEIMLAPSLRRVRRRVRHGWLCLAPACAVLGVALLVPAFRAGLFVARFARLLRGPSPRTVVAAIVAVLHSSRLRVRGRDGGEHHDASQRAHASPKIHPSLHAVLL